MPFTRPRPWPLLSSFTWAPRISSDPCRQGEGPDCDPAHAPLGSVTLSPSLTRCFSSSFASISVPSPFSLTLHLYFSLWPLFLLFLNSLFFFLSLFFSCHYLPLPYHLTFACISVCFRLQLIISISHCFSNFHKTVMDCLGVNYRISNT